MKKDEAKNPAIQDSKRKKLFIFTSLAPLLLCMAGCMNFNWQKNKTVMLGFAGDVMLGRLVNEKIKQTGFAYPWGSVAPLLHANDLNLINLETTLSSPGTPIPKVFNFRSDPQNVQTLIEGNINVVNLANNHSLDFGPKGLLETLDTLKRANIGSVGAGRNLTEAQQPFIIKKKGIKIGFIGFTDNEPTWLAGAEKPGTNYIRVGDIQAIKEQISRVRSRVDLLIASIHWGPNMREKPTDEFVSFAHTLIDAGIDIIHGHSAHVFQGIEVYQDKLIMYDTGDFVDDYKVDPKLRNDLSFLFQIEVDRSGLKALQLIPVKIDNMQVNLAADEEYSWALERMKKLSAEFGTIIKSNGTWQR